MTLRKALPKIAVLMILPLLLACESVTNPCGWVDTIRPGADDDIGAAQRAAPDLIHRVVVHNAHVEGICG